MSKTENVVSLPDIDALEAQASEWVMRLEDGEASKEDLSAFYAWRATSEQHKAAFDRMAALWGELDVVEGLNDYAAAARGESPGRRFRRGWKLPRHSLSLTAAVVLVVTVAAGVLYPIAGPGPDYRSAFETAVGEQLLIELPDGSTVELNTSSSVEVAFSNSARDIRLLTGEAYFNVATDTRKPFSVYANSGIVTAVGTEFTVRIRDKLVDVIVTEGRVALASRLTRTDVANSKPKPKEALLEVTSGQSASFNERVEQLHIVDEEALERKLSWREGLLTFAGEPLGEVIEDVSRYTDLSIEVEDEALRALPVAGYFKIGEVGAMFEALEIMVDVRAEYIDTNRVRLVRPDDNKEKL